MKTQRRLVKASKTVRMNLPKAFFKKLGIELNEMVDVELNGSKIIITKAKEEDEKAC